MKRKMSSAERPSRLIPAAGEEQQRVELAALGVPCRGESRRRAAPTSPTPRQTTTDDQARERVEHREARRTHPPAPRTRCRQRDHPGEHASRADGERRLEGARRPRRGTPPRAAAGIAPADRGSSAGQSGRKSVRGQRGQRAHGGLARVGGAGRRAPPPGERTRGARATVTRRLLGRAVGTSRPTCARATKRCRRGLQPVEEAGWAARPSPAPSPRREARSPARGTFRSLSRAFSGWASGPKNTRCTIHSMYAAPRMTPVGREHPRATSEVGWT